MEAHHEELAAWLRERGFAFDRLWDVWERRVPGGPPIRLTSESLCAVSPAIVPTVKREIERALADAGADG